MVIAGISRGILGTFLPGVFAFTFFFALVGAAAEK